MRQLFTPQPSDAVDALGNGVAAAGKRPSGFTLEVLERHADGSPRARLIQLSNGRTVLVKDAALQHMMPSASPGGSPAWAVKGRHFDRLRALDAEGTVALLVHSRAGAFLNALTASVPVFHDFGWRMTRPWGESMVLPAGRWEPES